MLKYKGMLSSREDIDEERLLEICEQKINKDRKRIPDHVINFLKAEDKVQYIIDLYRKEVRNNELFPQRKNVIYEINQRLKKGEKLGIECPQSWFLSNKEGHHWGSSTSADTRADAAIVDLGIDSKKYDYERIIVHKVPPSRVGAGANPIGLVPQLFFSEKGINTLNDVEGVCTDYDSIQKQFWNSIHSNGILEPTTYEDKSGKYLINVAMAISSSREYNECGATTKKPRVLGVIDLVAHAEVMDKQGPFTSISAMDRLDKCDKVGACIAYIYHHPENKTVDCEGTIYKNTITKN